MKNVYLQKLIDKAREMALTNTWGEDAYKVNMEILKMDNNNCAACTRLAKYYKLNNNIIEAKNMYLKALSIDPNNRGALNNLEDFEREQKENDAVNEIKTTKELVKMGKVSMQKGRLSLAAKVFSKAYSIEPILTYAVSLAGVYKKMGKYDSIEELYKKLIEGSHAEGDIETINNEFKTFRLKLQEN